MSKLKRVNAACLCIALIAGAAPALAKKLRYHAAGSCASNSCGDEQRSGVLVKIRPSSASGWEGEQFTYTPVKDDGEIDTQHGQHKRMPWSTRNTRHPGLDIDLSDIISNADRTRYVFIKFKLIDTDKRFAKEADEPFLEGPTSDISRDIDRRGGGTVLIVKIVRQNKSPATLATYALKMTDGDMIDPKIKNGVDSPY